MNQNQTGLESKTPLPLATRLVNQIPALSRKGVLGDVRTDCNVH